MTTAEQTSQTPPAIEPRRGSWRDQLVQIYRRDPKKTSLVAAVSVVMLGLCIHLIFHGPSAAAASFVRPAASGNADSKIAIAPVAENSEIASAALINWLNQPRRPAGRNLFAINLDAYPPQTRVSVTDSHLESHSGEDQAFWDEVAKSLSSQADHSNERQNRMDILRRQASELRLEKITMTASPKAIINGAEVQEGSIVASFRVLTIEPQRIVVEREGIRLEVPLH